MVGYEPPSGWNLPPGCFEGDPNAPWNREEPKTCGDCSHLLEGCCDYGICEFEFEEAFDEEAGKRPGGEGADGGMGGCEVGARLDRRTLQEHAGGLVQTVRWIAASCAALLVAVVALELYVIRTLAAGLVVLALLACG